MKNRSHAQVERQDSEHRANGKYAKTNPCMCCGKSAGINYWSDRRVDIEPGFSTFALVVCKRCEKKGGAMENDAEALEFYKNGEAMKRGFSRIGGY